jgi:hypothetical protein
MSRLNAQFPDAALFLDSIKTDNGKREFLKKCIEGAVALNPDLHLLIHPLVVKPEAFNSLSGVAALWRCAYDEAYFRQEYGDGQQDAKVKMLYFSMARLMNALECYFKGDCEACLYECFMVVDEDRVAVLQDRIKKWV